MAPEQNPQFSRFSLAAVAIGGLVLLAMIAYLLLDEDPATTVQILPPLPTASATISPTPAPIQVYIIGAVATPNLIVELPPQSRVQAAIDAAGGVLPEADPEGFNPSDFLIDGQMIEIPFLPVEGEAEASPRPLPTSANAQANTNGNNGGLRVNINIASLDELQELPGIGPSYAQNIIDYREANGPFTSLEELVNVPGIGEARLDQIRPYITLN